MSYFFHYAEKKMAFLYFIAEQNGNYAKTAYVMCNIMKSHRTSKYGLIVHKTVTLGCSSYCKRCKRCKRSHLDTYDANFICSAKSLMGLYDVVFAIIDKKHMPQVLAKSTTVV